MSIPSCVGSSDGSIAVGGPQRLDIGIGLEVAEDELEQPLAEGVLVVSETVDPSYGVGPPVRFRVEEGLVVDDGVGVDDSVDRERERKAGVSGLADGGPEAGLPVVGALSATADDDPRVRLLGRFGRGRLLESGAVGKQRPEGVFDRVAVFGGSPR